MLNGFDCAVWQFANCINSMCVSYTVYYTVYICHQVNNDDNTLYVYIDRINSEKKYTKERKKKRSFPVFGAQSRCLFSNSSFKL